VIFYISSLETDRSHCVGIPEAIFLWGKTEEVIDIIHQELMDKTMHCNYIIAGGSEGTADCLAWLHKFKPSIPTVCLFVNSDESKVDKLMQETNWNSFSYVKSCEPHFMPGNDNGDGLALAYLTPEKVGPDPRNKMK
jgi:hypothetical protein